MKYHYFASFLVVALLSVNKGVKAEQLAPVIDAPQWALTLQQRLDGESKTLTTQERELLTELQPVIEQQQYQQALQQLNREAIGESALLLGLRGQVNLALKNFSEAESDLKAALTLNPDNLAALQNLATVYLSRQELEKARPYLVKTLQTGAISAQLYGQLGYINLQTALPMSAISAYEKALMLEPDNKQWSQGLLYALVQSGATSRANALVEELLQQQPNDAVLWLQRAQLAMEQKHYQKAISSLESAVHLQSNNLKGQLQLASLHAQSGSLHRAAEILQTINTEDFNNDDINSRYLATLQQVAQKLIANEQWQLFEKLYDDINQSNLSPTQHAGVLFLNAKYHQRRGNIEQAEKTFKQLLQVDPANGTGLIQLANLNYERGHLTQAQLLYQRASSIKEVEEQANMGLAQIAIDQKDYRKALELLQRIYNNNPGRTELRDNIRTLEGLL
ncbi:MAG: tetratricopeptide repeat protein [Alteromonadaceae bacterium]|nr:tetratricopeptide repeat protein [Alteromonadaceae bacterium]